MPGKKGFYWQTNQKGPFVASHRSAKLFTHGPFVESHRSAKLFTYMLWCR